MAGIIIKDNVTDAMKAQVFVEEILGLARPQYNLRKLCRVFDLGNEIIAHIPIGTVMAGQEKVPENVEGAINAAAFTDLDFECWKNVIHIVMSDEASLKSKFNLMQVQVSDGARDLARMENKQIGEVLVGLIDVSGGNWKASATNPMDDIMPVVATLEELGYSPDVICMQSSVYASFLANTYVRGAYPEGRTVLPGAITMIGDLEIMRDAALVAATAIIGDRKASFVTLADGPTIVSQYDGGAKFNKGYAVAKFQQPLLGVSAAGRELTGLLT
jgi:hypothetical protein